MQKNLHGTTTKGNESWNRKRILLTKNLRNVNEVWTLANRKNLQ